MQKVVGYLNTQMIDQSHYHGMKRGKRYIKAITELSNEMMQHFSESSANFGDLNQKACQIYEKIGTQEEEINEYILQGIIIPKSPGKPN